MADLLKTNESSCEFCEKNEKEKTGFGSGLFYGAIPHLGCILFVVFSVLGAATASAFLKPFLLNRYFFYYLLALSAAFAAFSAVLYLKKQNRFSFSGIKSSANYLLTLFGTTIAVNLILFFFVFPFTADFDNLPKAAALGTSAAEREALSKITLAVDIPCPGHAPLISGELKNLKGIRRVNFKTPNLFEIFYNSSETSEESITALPIFNEFRIEQRSNMSNIIK